MSRRLLSWGLVWGMPLILSCSGGLGGAGSKHLTANYPGCEGYAVPISSKYVLPFPANNTAIVIQTNCTAETHHGPWRYAYDFEMPIYANIYAARAGTVIKVKQDVDNGSQGGINFVKIRHPDNSIGRYMRLKKDSVLVTVDSSITQGQLLAQVANTDGEPITHLHFDVVSNSDENETLPVTFKNAEGSSEAAALKVKIEYRAVPYTANTD